MTPPAHPLRDTSYCRVYWGSHGCDRPRGHEGPHLCLSCREDDEDGWVGAPPYYGPDTHFYGEDAPLRCKIKSVIRNRKVWGWRIRLNVLRGRA